MCTKFRINKWCLGTTDDTLAAEVFGRGPDYDRSIDPIVSMQTDILRRALARYYQNSGKNDPIRINIPLATYVPVFKKRKLNGL